jgi:hypothetical protein
MVLHNTVNNFFYRKWLLCQMCSCLVILRELSGTDKEEQGDQCKAVFAQIVTNTFFLNIFLVAICHSFLRLFSFIQYITEHGWITSHNDLYDEA